jgi:cell division protein FtsL
MNETETHLPSADSDLELQVAALQRQVFMLLLALIVVSATVVFYLYYQSRIVSYDLNQMRPQAMQVIQLYQRNQTAIENLNKELGNYALAHPEFQPVLKKYGWSPTATPK